MPCNFPFPNRTCLKGMKKPGSIFSGSPYAQPWLFSCSAACSSLRAVLAVAKGQVKPGVLCLSFVNHRTALPQQSAGQAPKSASAPVAEPTTCKSPFALFIITQPEAASLQSWSTNLIHGKKKPQTDSWPGSCS